MMWLREVAYHDLWAQLATPEGDERTLLQELVKRYEALKPFEGDLAYLEDGKKLALAPAIRALASSAPITRARMHAMVNIIYEWSDWQVVEKVDIDCCFVNMMG